MRVTRLSTLGSIVVVVALLSWLLEKAFTSSGRPQLSLQMPMPFVLVGIAVIVLLLAIPVRRRLHGDPKPLNPFYALNVLVLAKSSSLTGAMFVGVAVGFIVFALGLPVVVIDERMWITVATGIAALILSIVGLIAEYFCRIPPVDDTKTPSGPAPIAEA